jgi:hypothetical protein
VQHLAGKFILLCDGRQGGEVVLDVGVAEEVDADVLSSGTKGVLNFSK